MNDALDALKPVVWEETKGKLRAFVALQGAYHGGDLEDYYRVKNAVETFIKSFEDEGLHE